MVVECGTAQPPSHTLWLRPPYKPSMAEVTSHIPERHEACSVKRLPQNNNVAATGSPLSLPRPSTSVHNCHEHGTHLHRRHRGSNMAASYVVRYHIPCISNCYFTSLLHAVNSRSSPVREDTATKQCHLVSYNACTASYRYHHHFPVQCEPCLHYTCLHFATAWHAAVLRCSMSPSQAETSELIL